MQCLPPSYYWERVYLLLKLQPPSPITGQCNSATAVLVALPLIFSLISDIGVLVLPIVTLTGLRMRTSRKLGLIVVFSLGGLACICEILRIWLEVAVSAFDDPTYDNVSFVIFTFAEGNLAIAAACAPLLASQWKWTVQKIYSLRGSQSSISNVALKNTFAQSPPERHFDKYRQEAVDFNMSTLPHVRQSSIGIEMSDDEHSMVEGDIERGRD